jgi:hypothetical protein
MKKKKEIVLYVEDIGLVKQKKITNISSNEKEKSLLQRAMIKKSLLPSLVIKPQK